MWWVNKKTSYIIITVRLTYKQEIFHHHFFSVCFWWFYDDFNTFWVISQPSVYLTSFPGQLISNYQFVRKSSDRLIPYDFLIGSERQMTIKLNVQDQLSPGT